MCLPFRSNSQRPIRESEPEQQLQPKEEHYVLPARLDREEQEEEQALTMSQVVTGTVVVQRPEQQQHPHHYHHLHNQPRSLLHHDQSVQQSIRIPAVGSATLPGVLEDATSSDTSQKSESALQKLRRSLKNSMGNSHGKPLVFTDDVRLDHFKLLRVVGKGAFGKVRIVERKDTGLTFALKYIRKDEVVRSENVRNIVRERRMLEHLNHPFLCNLRYSFQDYEYLYLVVDLMSGGDLRFHISRKTYTEECIRFWIAELGCALNYVHGQGIIHRDVKPDNVLLDSEGHVHLADFNVASDYNPKKLLTSKSGTLAYLAPEVYAGRGYSKEVDWWGLGVVFYECIYSRRPFEARSHDDLAAQIRAAKPKYPLTTPLVSTACQSGMKSLLEKNVHDRIGANGFETFKNHPFLVELDFAALERKEITPVFIPSSDKTNFDATYDLEELLLEEAPLEARAKHQKPRPALKANATPQEKRAAELYGMIEKLFEPFDYTRATFDKLTDSPTITQIQANETTLPKLPNDGTLALSQTPSPVNGPMRSSPSPKPTGLYSPTGSLTGKLVAGANGIPRSVPQNMQPATKKAPTSSSDRRHAAGPSSGMTSNPPPVSSVNKKIKGSSRSKSTSGQALTWAQGSTSTKSGSLASTNKSFGSAGSYSVSGRMQGRSVTSAGPLPSGSGKKGNIFGLFSSRRSRALSPKRIENGVLGKDGARVVQDWGT